MLRVPVDRLQPGEMTLDPRASRYVARVHRLAEGEPLLLFDPQEGMEAEASVTALGRSSVRCRVGKLRPAAVRARRSVTLLQAIGKGDKLDAVVRDATELGATRVVAVETRRSIVQLHERAEERMRRVRRIAVEAARQCGRGDTPEVSGPLPWRDALRLTADDRLLRLCLWERATSPIGPELRNLSADQPPIVAVGPEGGLEEDEVEAARASGFVVVSLGPFVLRTETVAAAVLGAVLVLGA